MRREPWSRCTSSWPTSGCASCAATPVAFGPPGTARWQVTIDHGRVALVERPAGAADLRFSADHPTAAQIASGELAAQRAFVEGRLRVGGDLSLLTRHQRVFATIDDTLAKVRTETTFD